MRYVYFIGIVAFVLFVIAGLDLAYHTLPTIGPQTVSVPASNADVEGRLADAINAHIPGPASSDPTNWVRPLASAIASKMRDYPTEYNKPDTLLLGDSTPVQLVIKTNEKQDTAPLFEGLEGAVTETTVKVANDVSAQLTGPPDRCRSRCAGTRCGRSRLPCR